MPPCVPEESGLSFFPEILSSDEVSGSLRLLRNRKFIPLLPVTLGQSQRETHLSKRKWRRRTSRRYGYRGPPPPGLSISEELGFQPGTGDRGGATRCSSRCSNTQRDLITPIEWINTCVNAHSDLIFFFIFILMAKTLQINSLSKFRGWNTIPLPVTTSLYLKSPELSRVITESSCPLGGPHLPTSLSLKPPGVLPVSTSLVILASSHT